MIAGNYIGVDATGTVALGNRGDSGVFVTVGNAIRIGSNADGVNDTGERNVISANVRGITLFGANTFNNSIAGNYIGTNAAGTVALGNTENGVKIVSGAHNNTVGGANTALRNVISGNAGNGILISDVGTNNNIVAENYIGLNAAGTAGLANSNRGVYVLGGAAGTRIGTDGDGVNDAAERNVISGNGIENVWIEGVGTDDTVIAGNYIGLNAAGTAGIPNASGAGLAVNAGPKRTRIGTNADGIADADERNVISGNRAEGLLVAGPNTQFTTVAGNYIGTNAAGTAAVPNLWVGIQVRTAPTDTRIGTDGNGVNDATEQNVISGNNSTGVFIQGAGTARTVVAGNLIGLNAAGIALGNNGYGVHVAAGATDTRIGTDGSNDGFNAAERNVISANNGHGVLITDLGTDRSVVAGNYIGINAAGTAAIGNNGVPVGVVNGAKDTRIGTDGNGVGDTAERNVMSGNLWEVLVEGTGTDRTVIAGNYIGTNAAGDAAIGNGAGITVRYGPHDTRIGTDGNGNGFDGNERNVISGNNWVGIQVQTTLWNGQMPAGGVTTDRTVIAGNYIGLKADGSAPLGNASAGIYIHDMPTNTRVGTDGNGVADDLERNVISGNQYTGVYVAGWDYMNLLVADQLISGAIPRTMATATVSTADYSDVTSTSPGNWTFDNPVPGGGGDFYVIRSTGTIQVNTAGAYTFALSGDDGGRLRIDGADVVVDDSGHGFADRFATVNLGVGTHTFEWIGMEYNFAAGWELSVAVGSGRTGPVTEANGWRVLARPTHCHKLHFREVSLPPRITRILGP